MGIRKSRIRLTFKRMGDKGLEPSTSRVAASTFKYNSCTSTRRLAGYAVGAPHGAPSDQTDPALAELVRRWATLPPAVKAGIAAMIRASVESEKP